MKRQIWKYIWLCVCIVFGCWTVISVGNMRACATKSTAVQTSVSDTKETVGQLPSKSESDELEGAKEKFTSDSSGEELKKTKDDLTLASKSVALKGTKAELSSASKGAMRAVEWSGQGDGSSGNPYQIGAYEQLKEFAQIVNGTKPAACAILTGSFNCGGFTDWTPIGSDDSHKYNGTFDGQGFTITGLSTSEGYTGTYVGLFGYVGQGGTVKNVGLKDGHIRSSESGIKYVGAVAGYNEGTITSCYNTGAVNGTSTNYAVNVGGVAGWNNGTITNCNNTGAVGGTATDVGRTANVGGVAGDNEGTITSCYNTGAVNGTSTNYAVNVGGVVGENSGTIMSCYNTGAVEGTYKDRISCVGGVVGYNNGSIMNCYNTEVVTGIATYSTSTNVYANVGGVAGWNAGTITSCYNTGTVNGTAYRKQANVGGVAGDNEGTITSCYNTGAVSGTATVGNVSVGGVVGENSGTGGTAKVENCYSAGTVTGTTGSETAYVGGVIGWNSSTVQYCYYDCSIISYKAIGNHEYSPSTVKGLNTAHMTGLSAIGTDYTQMNFTDPTIWIEKDDIKGDVEDEFQNYYWFYPHLKGFLYDTELTIANWPQKIKVGVTWNNLQDYAYDDSPKTLPTVDKITINGEELPEKTAGTRNYIVEYQKKNADGQWVGITEIQESSDYRDVIKFEKYGNKTITENFMIYYEINSYNGGSTGGTISLKRFAQIVNGTNPAACAKLTAPIDCGRATDWTPIGSDDSHKYNGTFDGQGFTITGLSTSEGYTGTYVGLFGYVGSGGTVKNVGLKDGHVRSSASDIKYVGAVAGINEGTITSCYNTGAVSGTSTNNNAYVGGVLGYNWDGTVQSCYNTGAVNGEGEIVNVGGVAGNNRKTITSCYNTGAVSGTATNGNVNVGGVVGTFVQDGTGEVENCYSAGTVIGTVVLDTKKVYKGGVIGYNNKRIVKYCYYDSTVCSGIDPIGGGTITGDKIISVTGLTTAQMTGLNALKDANMKFVYNAGEENPWIVKDDIKGDVEGDFQNYYWFYPRLKGFLYDMEPTIANWPPKIKVGVNGLQDYVYDGQAHALPTVSIKVNGEDLPEETAGTKNYTVEYQKKNAAGQWVGITEIQESSDYRVVIKFKKYGDKTITENFMIYYEIDRYNGGATSTGPISLKEFAQIVNGTNPVACAKLTKNIECKNDPNDTVYATDWTPIGDHHIISVEVNCDYIGTFDGQGFTIKGLSTPTNYKEIYAGLFGYVGSDGTVKNVGLKGGHIHSGSMFEKYVGAVAGYNAGTITSCYNIGDVTGTTNYGNVYVGGVVGENSGTIMSCYNTGAVNGTSSDNGDVYVGGVAGINEVSGTVKDCYSAGTVTSTAHAIKKVYKGGVIGYNNESGKVQYCYYDRIVCEIDYACEPNNWKAIGNENKATVTGLTTAQMTYGTWIDSEITQMKGFTDNTWLAKVKESVYAFYPHLKGFLYDTEPTLENWPPKNAMSIKVTIDAIVDGGGSAIQVYYWADDDDETAKDEAYFAPVQNGEKVPYGAILGISVKLATGYKLDTITYTMGSAAPVTLDKPFLQCTDNLKIVATVSQLTYDLTLVSDPDNIGAQLTSEPENSNPIAYGVSVTITANNTQVSGYTFIGWYDGTKLLTKDIGFAFVMTNAITFTARYVSSAEKTVIYMSNDTIYHKDIVTSSAIDSYEYPTKNPIPMHGWTFSGWDTSIENIRSALKTSNLVVVTAEFKPLECSIEFTVNDPKATVPTKSEILSKSEWRTVRAAGDSGFSHWERVIGSAPRVIYSYRQEVSLRIVEDTTLYAIYAKQSVAEIRSVRYDTKNKSMSITVGFKVPDGATLVQVGVKAGSSDQSMTFTQPFPVIEGTTIPLTYTWVLNNVLGGTGSSGINPGYELYMRGYMTYESGTYPVEYTEDGDVYHAVAGLDYDIEDQAVALIESEKYDAATNKAIFVSYISVPDGCVIGKAGVVAVSSNYVGFDPANAVLTCDNAEYIVESQRAVGEEFILYTWVKKDVAPNTKWYARPYVFYTKNSVEHKVYGAMRMVEAPESNP